MSALEGWKTNGVRHRKHPDGYMRVLVNQGEIVSAMLFTLDDQYLKGWQAEEPSE